MAKVITFGEIMLRLATPGYLRFNQAKQFEATFGGGEANVAVSLANYGIETEFVTRFPKNDIAASCIKDLHSYGVGTKHCVFGGERLGIYFLETGAVARPSKVVYDRAHSSISEIETGMIDWDKVFEGAEWFHWTGITPAISQGAADVCREPKVIITLRGSINANHNTWGGVLYSNGTLYQSPRYDITHIVDRVGGGDSFMGGLLYGLITYPEDDQKALNFAVAASCLKHTIYGDFNQVTVAEVENLMKGDGSGRVSR